jgi:hypothetical protein
MNHKRQGIYIDAPSGDVGGDEDFDFPFPESLEHAFAHLLGDIAVETVGGVAAGEQCLGAFIHGFFGVAEDDGETWVFEVEDAAKDFDFGTFTHFVVALFDGVNGESFLLDLYGLSIFSELANQALDGFAHGGREEKGLAVSGKLG